MTTIRTANSVYHLDGKKVMLESGTPSGHLPFREWVEVATYSKPRLSERFRIVYHDGYVRVTTPITSIEETSVGQSSSQ